jgi:hypothetical protein
VTGREKVWNLAFAHDMVIVGKECKSNGRNDEESGKVCKEEKAESES